MRTINWCPCVHDFCCSPSHRASPSLNLIRSVKLLSSFSQTGQCTEYDFPINGHITATGRVFVSDCVSVTKEGLHESSSNGRGGMYSSRVVATGIKHHCSTGSMRFHAMKNSSFSRYLCRVSNGTSNSLMMSLRSFVSLTLLMPQIVSSTVFTTPAIFGISFVERDGRYISLSRGLQAQKHLT